MNKKEILKKIEKSDISEEEKNILKSRINANTNPSASNPLIDRNPISSGMDIFFKNLISRISRESGLQKIYGGYNKIMENATTGFESYGMTSLMGFDINQINETIVNNDLYICYIALPIDDMDNLIENPNLLDWDFEERILNRILPSQTIPAGAIYINDKKTKLRTIKFLVEME
ncbi:MAG: hypothetical protein HOO07_08130 [Candidatus Marinimicrobia bacterium]|jgi:hypothetical protein|nr:hypothetical protein [Candidatus Neomarinimicrobiota bacterium]